MYKLVITQRAETHIVKACNYYEEQLSGLSERFLTELNHVYDKIALNPQHYSFIFSTEKYRDAILDKFPFVVVFEIDDDKVIVLAVLNTRQETKL